MENKETGTTIYEAGTVSDKIDVCPVDGELHPSCENCTVSNCVRGMAILRMRAREE